jgi:Acetyltransferase (GNAT) domain
MHAGMARAHAALDGWTVEVISRADLASLPRWRHAFATERKDHRYYEVVEDTIAGFDYRYFGVRDAGGVVRAVTPFFLLDQDLLAGSAGPLRSAVEGIRRVWPRFMRMRTLMVGCVAGEGHLDEGDGLSHCDQARQLAATITRHAIDLKARLIVLKEFPAKYRTELACFLGAGYARVPSLPMTRLNIDYPDFDAYMTSALSSRTRRDFRRKWRAAASGPPIELEIVHDITPIVDEAYPLYLQVYQRSKLHFEKLTPDYFASIGRLMPDKVRFFVWRRSGAIVAFCLCMVQGDEICAEYIGLDYSVALDLHLYHYIVRDMLVWAMAHDYKWFRSSSLNYDPKFHFRHWLDPVDLYVRHTSPALNAILRRVLPLIEPTRYDKTLRRFPNYDELWGEPPAGKPA